MPNGTIYDVRLRDQDCTIEDLEIEGADPDVGIMSAYPVGYTIHDAANNDITDKLTPEEQKIVDKRLEAICQARYEDDWGD